MKSTRFKFEDNNGHFITVGHGLSCISAKFYHSEINLGIIIVPSLKAMDL